MPWGPLGLHFTHVLTRLRRFAREDLWQADLQQLDPWPRLGLTVLRVAVHVARSFVAGLGSLQAAGLTLVTLLALVPLLALVSGIAKGLGYGDRLDQALDELKESTPEGLDTAVTWVSEAVHKVSFGALGVIGSLVLAYSAMVLFVRVEQSVNRVWGVARGRSWYRRITDFVALIVLVPLLVFAALSLQSLLLGASWLREVAWLQWIYDAGVGFVPHVLVWIAFTAVYKLLPSAGVQLSSAAIAGVVAGSGWLFLHQFYLSTQLAVTRLNPIYGTLAALPLLLIYLQVTWTIVLVGAEVSHAVQYRDRLGGPRPVAAARPAVQLRVALLLTAEACRAFARAEGGCDVAALTARLGIPAEWIETAYGELSRAGILGAIADRPQLVVPMRPPESIRIGDVYAAILGPVPAELERELTLPGLLQERLVRIDHAVAEVLASDDFSVDHEPASER